MNDVLTATTAIAAVVAAVVAAIMAATVSSATTVGGRWVRAVLAIVGTLALTAAAVFILVLFKVPPFLQRSITIDSGAGDVACKTELSGSANVPENEAAWVLLVNSNGDFYPQGPSGHGAPVAIGGESKDWKLPGVIVSDKYYENASYQVVGIIVPLADSLRLQQLLATTDHLGADQISSRLLGTAVQQAKLVSSDGCAP